MAIKKYKIQQLQQDNTLLTLHPETDASIVKLDKTKAGTTADNVEGAIKEVKDQIKDGVVTGIKGSSESTYRKGNVEITKANIGLGNVNNTSDLDKPISTATQQALTNVLAVANGKTKTYVLSSATNNSFNSNNDIVTCNSNSSLTTITGTVVLVSNLAIGDIILVTELNVPDRYVTSIEGTNIKFYKMETSKVDLSEYATLEDLSHKIDEQEANDLIQDNLNIKLKDYVEKSANPVTDVTFDEDRNSITVGKLNGEGGEIVGGILTRNNISGIYSVVTVQDGQVTGGGVSFEVGSSGQSTPSNSLAVGGIFFQEI